MDASTELSKRMNRRFQKLWVKVVKAGQDSESDSALAANERTFPDKLRAVAAKLNLLYRGPSQLWSTALTTVSGSPENFDGIVRTAQKCANMIYLFKFFYSFKVSKNLLLRNLPLKSADGGLATQTLSLEQDSLYAR